MRWAALLLSLLATASEARPLQLLHSLTIESREANLQLSGLAFCDGELLTISDRHNNQLYRLQLETERGLAHAMDWRSIQAPPSSDQGVWGWAISLFSGRRLDWEGLACQGETLYLLSEQLSDVLLSSRNETRWLKFPQLSVGGMLRHTNAGLEGIALHEEGVLLAAERDARGLLLLVPDGDRWTLQRQQTPLPPLPPIADRNPDFSGLWYESPWLYTLERNLFRICRRDSGFQQQRCWSYADTELSPARSYRSEFGVAEGIAADETRIYLITDNNNKALLAAPHDRRPQLWIFAKPDDWSH
ncbi:hypothetical protein [Aestuariirhabdus sp. LZHN29]|uniref:hypothetical protein n=1 Tax=Aestuariirhabdus sp. LZHN29 TaxID=3417462 RepID=UPI003CE8FE96